MLLNNYGSYDVDQECTVHKWICHGKNLNLVTSPKLIQNPRDENQKPKTINETSKNETPKMKDQNHSKEPCARQTSNARAITESLFLEVWRNPLSRSTPTTTKKLTMGRCDVCFETRNVEVTTGTTNYSTPLQDRHCSLFWDCWFVVVSRDTVVVVVLVWMLILNKLTRNRHGCGNKIHSTTLKVTLNNTWQHVGFVDR